MLIVDNDGDSRDMYAVALSLMGFQPVAAINAEDAFARACAEHPDAIVTNLWLPEVSGCDLMRRLRCDPRTTSASIIALTADSSDSARQRAQEAGCDRFLLKPCLPDALAVEIRDVLASTALHVRNRRSWPQPATVPTGPRAEQLEAVRQKERVAAQRAW